MTSYNVYNLIFTLVQLLYSYTWLVEDVCIWYNIHISIFPSRSVRYDDVKGEVSPTTMWIGWVQSNFRNPTVKLSANLDNPFKSHKFCLTPYVALSNFQNLWGTREQLSTDI